MAYKRMSTPTEFSSGSKLTPSLIGIGMNFLGRSKRGPNIEDTLIAASLEGMVCDDLRVLSVLTMWIEIHHPWINADRLVRIVQQQSNERVRAYWCAIAHFVEKDRRFSRLKALYKGPPVDVLSTGTDFQIKRRGEDIRFMNSCLRVPSDSLRRRVGDVLSPAELAKRHLIYHHRILMGPSYRADMWAELEKNPTLSPSELARRTYGSFGTAWAVKHDFELLKVA